MLQDGASAGLTIKASTHRRFQPHRDQQHRKISASSRFKTPLGAGFLAPRPGPFLLLSSLRKRLRQHKRRLLALKQRGPFHLVEELE